LTRALNENLPPNYYAVSELSWQETRDLELSEENLAAVKIYYQDGGSHLVARIELLSPSNKRAPHAYLAMRQKMIGLGINMVDVDCLHEQASLFRGILPSYPQEEDAYPYCISLSDRRTIILVDYRQEPTNFNAYSPFEQERIRGVMGRIRETQTDGE
jgi:hypothetical protein